RRRGATGLPMNAISACFVLSKCGRPWGVRVFRVSMRSGRSRMDKTKDLVDPTSIKIADHVRFIYQGREVHGVVKKGRHYAHISCDEQQEFRVPYHKLEQQADRVHQPLRPVSEQRRVRFNSGDHVRFPFRGRELQGVLSRLNPVRGHVIANNGTEYRVPYTVLSPLEEPAS